MYDQEMSAVKWYCLVLHYLSAHHQKLCEERKYILVFRGHVCLGILTLNWVLWLLLCGDIMRFALNAAPLSLGTTTKHSAPPKLIVWGYFYNVYYNYQSFCFERHVYWITWTWWKHWCNIVIFVDLITVCIYLTYMQSDKKYYCDISIFDWFNSGHNWGGGGVGWGSTFGI